MVHKILWGLFRTNFENSYPITWAKIKYLDMFVKRKKTQNNIEQNVKFMA